MASLASTYRELARLSSRSFRRNGVSKGIHSCSRILAAQNFTMPAMSPTMTEGNIASWKVKEGDKFSTGDVLLEIETDKAQMDVEAQDDGIVAKITQSDGSKGVKVGTRIAVLAEVDDDLSTLSIPEEASASAPAPQEETKSGADTSKSADSQVEAQPSPKAAGRSSDKLPQSPSIKPSGNSTKQTYPPYPSVSQLLHENNISKSDMEKIPASGPQGRLLKGDVLAYIGKIKPSYSSDQSARISKLGRLDLSNIKIAPSKQVSPPSKVVVPAVPAPETDTEIAVTISLKAVQEVQERIQRVLGTNIPIDTFVSRAIEISNEDLPRSKDIQPSADELFNSVLGLDKITSSSSRGYFLPQIVALPSIKSQTRAVPTTKPDVIDMLIGKSPSKGSRRLQIPDTGVIVGSNTIPNANVFSVSVPKGEEKRARVFLERVKTILQVEPGRLVI